jgi:hypothetical protein
MDLDGLRNKVFDAVIDVPLSPPGYLQKRPYIIYLPQNMTDR